ncbi:MAG TPA: isoprenylcysteine carboxylmethyltransferase family protein [Planctomycetota bacterium]|nr:isoprenylcysteine carboxylmethyltransferase family protein [Planctomycetota bacterium]
MESVESCPIPEAPADPPPPPGGLLFRYRNLLPIGLVVFLIAVPWGRLPPALWQFIAGGALILAGVALRLWCILQIGGSARKTSRLKANHVISWGPYSILRNPIYVANTTVFAGFTVASGLLWALPVVLITLGLWYNAIVRREEDFLAEKHPQAFAEYTRLARRWIPRFQYRARPPDVPPYPFPRALKRERGHLISVGVGMAFLLLLRLLPL